MSVSRETRFAGSFYPADPATVRDQLAELFAGLPPQPAIGGVAPHAGWVFSGRLAARTITCLAAFQPQTLVLFGAAHRMLATTAAVADDGLWETPIGPLEIDAELVDRLAGIPELAIQPAAHDQEHSLEVQLPLIKYAIPDVRIVPILVRPGPHAPEIGRAVAERLAGTTATQSGALGENRPKSSVVRESALPRVGFLASTDLTHYGPRFGFEPEGRGVAGLRWAKEVNDRAFIAAIRQGDPDAIWRLAAERHAACGGGAVAALVAAMRFFGRREYVELAHTTSSETAPDFAADPHHAVGYHAGIFPAA